MVLAHAFTGSVYQFALPLKICSSYKWKKLPADDALEESFGGNIRGWRSDIPDPLDVPPDSFPLDPEVMEIDCEERPVMQFEEGVEAFLLNWNYPK